MEQKVYDVQEVELVMSLGSASNKPKIGTTDVTKFLEECHMRVIEKFPDTLSFTVTSGYEAHYNKELGKTDTDNVAVMKAGWLVGPGMDTPHELLGFYCEQLLERFKPGVVHMKVFPIIQVIGYIG